MTARRRLVGALVVVVGAGLLGGCALPDFGAQDAGTEQGRSMLHLWRGSIVAALAVGVLVWGLIAWSVVRYRRRGRDDLPGQRQYHVPLEVVYTIVPVVVVAVLFGVSYATQRDVDRLAADPDVVIDVTGFQWQWQFEYVGEGVTVTGLPPANRPVLMLPKGETARIRLHSADVVHSFYVPGFLFKRDVIPGVDNQFDVTPTRTATYPGHCAEFCGLDHARMLFDVQVVSPARFQRWLDRHRDGGAP